MTRALTPAEAALVADILLRAIAQAPYLSRAISALSAYAVDGLGTVGVDAGWRLYIDPVWLASLDPSVAAYVIAHHEVEHLLRDHHARLSGPAANVAADLEINSHLDPALLPESACYPGPMGLPSGLLAEEYIRLIDEPAECTCEGGSGAGAPQAWELPDDGTAVDAAAAEMIRDAVAEEVRAASARGEAPAGLAIWAEARGTPPAVDWRRELRATLARGLAVRGRSDSTWSRVSRRYRHGAPLLPGRVDYLPRVGIVVDTSGSMGGAAADAIGTVVSVCRAYPCRVWQGDTETTLQTAGLPARWVGGGGTDLRPILAAAAAASDVVIVVTDGDTPWPDIAPTVPVVVVLVAPPIPVPSWARVVQVGGQ